MIEFKNLRIDLGDVLVEIVSIVLAILLAFVISGWHDRTTRHSALHSSLVNIRQEMTLNQRALRSVMPVHKRYLAVFTKLLERNSKSERITFDQLRAAVQQASSSGFHYALLQSIAWEITQNSTAVSDMPYKQRAGLTQIYQGQVFVQSAQLKFVNDLFAPNGPPSGNYFYAADVGIGNLGDVVAGEEDLSKIYTAELKLLPSQ
ncbi:MAG: hypothetical protein M3Y21_02965 [Candidatus Eremiobacteraeota bacterium]|nr:hypothetical protein [Candidatus Eremiobacteraeota bacterium]